jgi:hypothetical protein
MIKAREWPVRAMYILIAAALAISLFITAAPALKVSADPGLSEWDRVSTPTIDGWVLAPESDIMDIAVANGGDVAYAVVGAYNETCGDGFVGWDYRLLKSEDGAATWDDITDDDWIDDGYHPLAVATDGVDADFVAVALLRGGSVYVSISTDGGDTFTDPELVDSLTTVYDFAVSPEAAGKRDIAIGGGTLIYRSTVTGDSLGDWDETTTDYPGWDGGTVVEIKFSPSWATDKTVLVVTANATDVYLQCGSWGTTSGWNDHSTLSIDSVPIITGETIPLTLGALVAGIALPSNYNSKATDTRLLWVWVNYGSHESRIVRVDNDEAYPLELLGQIKNGNVWLTNISYWGTINEGKAMASVLGDGTGVSGYAACCAGVQVYRKSPIKDMQICCETWEKACKLPTGIWAMAVAYVRADKAYAVALGPQQSYDESAWSVSFDDGDIWNQLSLIDTKIDYLSDVAVSPDCNKMMLVSVHKVTIDYDDNGYCGCDSVWLKATNLPEAEEYSGKWLRTWSGSLEGVWWVDDQEVEYPGGMLRLAPEETTGDTVYLFDYGTNNVYKNDLETMGCWTPISSTVINDIVDLAAQDADTVYALGADGNVAKFDEDEWYEEVDSKVDAGWTIAVHGEDILVGGRNGEVSYSDDGGETFTKLDDIDISGADSKVTVAFDTYFDTNNTIYAAVEAWKSVTEKLGGIYRWVINATDEKWTDLKAEPLESQIGVSDGDSVDETVEVAFTGLVVDRPGNPFTNIEKTGGVIYASYYGVVPSVVNNQTVYTRFTGAARSLDRDVTVCTTCITWDFLHVGLTVNVEGFDAAPDALKICGCLTPDSNTKLFAIDAWWDYDMCEGQEGAVWTYEDCYAKKAPEITSPADGAVIPSGGCIQCASGPFTVLWDTLCDACSYDIAFALDEDFTMPVKVNNEDTTFHLTEQDVPAFSVLGGEAGGLSAETTYYIRVRAADAATGEIIHSWWSDPISIRTGPSPAAGAIELVAPVPGALNQPTKNVGFSWNLLADADSFGWKLSKNADLSAPLDSKNLTSKACTYAGTLDHGTTYYWQVKAYNEGALVSTSSIGTFTTGATGPFCDPIDGLCFDTEEALKAHEATSHPAPATPFWVWVVIAIGAVLVIVVIVLIFRTRRV